MKNIASYAFIILAAFIYHLGHPNLINILIPIGPIIGSLILIRRLFKADSLKDAIKVLIVFNIVITVLSFYWLTHTLQEFGQLPIAVAAIANLSFALIFQPHYWVLLITLFAIRKWKPAIENFYFKSAFFSFLFAAFMTTIEYFVPQQFPVLLGQPWIVLGEHLGLASIFGLPIFSFISYLFIGDILTFFKTKKVSKFNGLIILGFIIINPVLMKSPQEPSKLKTLNIRMVQANISSFLKVSSEQGGYASVNQVLDEYQKLSLAPFGKKNEKIDLVIWPETAYPFPIRSNAKNLEDTDVPTVLSYIALELSTELLIGGYDIKPNASPLSKFMTDYNTAFHIGRDQKVKETYHKRVLIPFGETLPFGPLNKTISEFIPHMAFFAVGEKFPLFKMEDGTSFITNICYELLRPEIIRSYLNSLVEAPKFMINLTNDSWYGNTLEPEQHLFLARWRALEFDLPILRSTNTGISVLIDKYGMEIKRLGYDLKGNLDLSLEVESTPKGLNSITLFQRYGFYSIIAFWFLCFIFHLLLLKLSHAKNS